MIANILNALADFRALATLETFERIFGKPAGATLRGHFIKLCKRNVVSFYTWLDPAQRLLFEAYLAAQLPPTCHLAEPRCVECGGELTESDIEAGEDVCLDCAVALVAEREAEASGVDSDGIEYEPGSLLATVRVRLEGGERDG